MVFTKGRDRTEDGLWTLEQAADFLKVSKTTLGRWIRDPLCNVPKVVTVGLARPHYMRIADVQAFRKSEWFGD